MYVKETKKKGEKAEKVDRGGRGPEGWRRKNATTPWRAVEGRVVNTEKC